MGILRGVIGGLAGITLASCSVVDDFSDRAVNYNLVAEQAQQQALLLNIVRASLGRPMQFTTLSSITGSATASGNSTLSVPFGHHRPVTGLSPDILGFSGTVTGGPTFTVPVLDTQEFYQGELKPLSGQEYRFFLDEGLSPAMLFHAFVDHIELTVAGAKPAKKFEFQSYIPNDYDLDRFTAVADYLLSLGLTIEAVHRPQIVGPPVTAAQLHDLRDIAQLTNAGLRIVPETEKKQPEAAAGKAGKKAEKSGKPEKGKVTGRYQLEKSTTIYRPCFEVSADKAKGIEQSLLCGSGDETDATEAPAGDLSRSSGGFVAPLLAARLKELRDIYVDELRKSSNEAAHRTADEIANLPLIGENDQLQVRLYIRSPEAILHHLGSIAARYLYKTGAARRVVQVKVGETYSAIPYPLTPCDRTSDPMSHQQVGPGYHCESLFVLTNARPDDSPLSVDYDGKTFYVVSDAHGGGRTTRVLDLAKQLLALHTSAKELPASNVLNIIGGGAP